MTRPDSATSHMNLTERPRQHDTACGRWAAMPPTLLLATLLVLLPAPQALGQESEATGTESQAANGSQVAGTDSPRDGAAPAPVDVHPLSPRATLDAYLTACREDRYNDAARFLDLSGRPDRDGGLAARRLKEVLDRHLWFDMERISPARRGRVDDGLVETRELLGTIPGTAGGEDPVEMALRPGDREPGWVFTAGTVRRIDAWYEGLGRNWLRDRMPALLLRPGPLEIQWWQWLALPLAFALAVVAARVVGWLVRPLVARLASKTSTGLDDLILDRLLAPAVFFLTLILFRSEVELLDLVIPAEELIGRLLRAAFLGGVFWVLVRAVDVVVQGAGSSAWIERRAGIRLMLPVMARTARIVVLALAAVTILQEFDFQVTGLLAGMGLAGMAVALAGQKSVENLIGSGTILADQPFKVGDFVRVGDMLATVEQIGLRSTRLRTLDRTLVTIPNGSLSELRLETFAARDRIRLYCILGLVYSTSAGQLAKVIEDLEQCLRDHPRVHTDTVRVRFVEFADYSLNLEVVAYLSTTDWAEFLTLRQEIFLRFMEVVEKNGSDFAFPTRTIHMEPAQVNVRQDTGGRPPA